MNNFITYKTTSTVVSYSYAFGLDVACRDLKGLQKLVQFVHDKNAEDEGQIESNVHPPLKTTILHANSSAHEVMVSQMLPTTADMHAYLNRGGSLDAVMIYLAWLGPGFYEHVGLNEDKPENNLYSLDPDQLKILLTAGAKGVIPMTIKVRGGLEAVRWRIMELPCTVDSLFCSVTLRSQALQNLELRDIAQPAVRRHLVISNAELAAINDKNGFAHTQRMHGDKRDMIKSDKVGAEKTVRMMFRPVTELGFSYIGMQLGDDANSQVCCQLLTPGYFLLPIGAGQFNVSRSSVVLKQRGYYNY